MESTKKTFQFGDQTVTLETGEIARQAGGAVMVTMGETMVLVTAVAAKEAREGQDFFPLTVNYQEKFYASGTIPGSFFRREGRPTERETLISRLIDRPIRPLFPKGFKNEVQIIATVKSADNTTADTEIPAMIGTSAALAISGVPFDGPIGAAQVGYINGEYILNPNTAQKEQSDLELSVAGTDTAVLMVESEAKILSEEIMLGAVLFGHEQMQVVISAIKELAAEVGKPAWDWTAPEEDTGLTAKVDTAGASKVDAAYQIADKMDRYAAMGTARDEIIAEVASEDGYSEEEVKAAVSKLEKKTVRGRIIAGNPRIDGRDNSTVRPIFVRTGVLPRSHGSALFTRGETQAIVVTTLGTERDAQLIDSLEGTTKDPFMLQYNFPPFSVGECGRTGSPGRREIGHGKLAKRSMMAVLPSQADFPYTMRVVSEITESNGSSSMASVCGSSLSMMDAGVPLKAPVAGIAMGLIKEGNDFAVLTDILGDEDHLGDMDFKVAGTDTGITALQMDIKIGGITRDIMEIALTQAKDARLFILDEMNKVISSGREELSQHAPRYVTFKINPDKIRDVIGKGGATIRSIQESTGVTIDISDDGTIKLAATDQSVSDKAKAMIDEIVADVEVDRVYEGKVSKIMDFGAFVTILPGKDGLVHISQISEERVEDVNNHLKEGQIIKVKVLEIDRQGRIRLSMKEV